MVNWTPRITIQWVCNKKISKKNFQFKTPYENVVIILLMRPANERRSYNETSSLICWTHKQLIMRACCLVSYVYIYSRLFNGRIPLFLFRPGHVAPTASGPLLLSRSHLSNSLANVDVLHRHQSADEPWWRNYLGWIRVRREWHR